jgi:sugar lactone lactonase YvrE
MNTIKRRSKTDSHFTLRSIKNQFPITNVYVADEGNHTIRKITPSGDVTTLAGLARTSGTANGAGSNARFNIPRGIAVDESGTVYVADQGNATIRKITPEGMVSTWAGRAGATGIANGSGANARFTYPEGLAVDNAGNVYVGDWGNDNVRKITMEPGVSTWRMLSTARSG